MTWTERGRQTRGSQSAGKAIPNSLVRTRGRNQNFGPSWPEGREGGNLITINIGLPAPVLKCMIADLVPQKVPGA